MTYAHARDVSFAGDEVLTPGSVPRGPVPVSPIATSPAPISLVRPVAADPISFSPASFDPVSFDPGPASPVAAGLLAEYCTCRVLLCPGPESARAAREFTAETLRGWRLDALLDEAMVIASELVTNAIRHGMSPEAPRPVELSWRRDEQQVVCTVTDGSIRPPVLAEPDLTADCGRGLQIVQALAAAWGWMMLGSAQKAVWAALQLVSGG
ncbi:MAG TPA: ATP-binding protein [Streptosporangiaceae bacterium]